MGGDGGKLRTCALAKLLNVEVLMPLAYRWSRSLRTVSAEASLRVCAQWVVGMVRGEGVADRSEIYV